MVDVEGRQANVRDFFFTEKHSAPPPIAKEKTGAPIPRLFRRFRLELVLSGIIVMWIAP